VPPWAPLSRLKVTVVAGRPMLSAWAQPRWGAFFPRALVAGWASASASLNMPIAWQPATRAAEMAGVRVGVAVFLPVVATAGPAAAGANACPDAAASAARACSRMKSVRKSVFGWEAADLPAL
jgi:hypothetical protein